jgi:hypothetical protein
MLCFPATVLARTTSTGFNCSLVNVISLPLDLLSLNTPSTYLCSANLSAAATSPLSSLPPSVAPVHAAYGHYFSGSNRAFPPTPPAPHPIASAGLARPPVAAPGQSKDSGIPGFADAPPASLPNVGPPSDYGSEPEHDYESEKPLAALPLLSSGVTSHSQLNGFKPPTNAAMVVAPTSMPEDRGSKLEFDMPHNDDTHLSRPESSFLRMAKVQRLQPLDLDGPPTLKRKVVYDPRLGDDNTE